MTRGSTRDCWTSNQPLRVQKLANLLHWDRNLPPDGSEPTTLADCLRGVPANRRMNVIAAFWQAREQAARYQALADQVEQLATLPAIAIASATNRAWPSPACGCTPRGARPRPRCSMPIAIAGRRVRADRRPWAGDSTIPGCCRARRRSRAATSFAARATGLAARAARLGRAGALQHDKLEERADGVIQADVHRRR